MVAVKQLEETRLRTSRALDTTEAEVVTRTGHVAQVPQKVLDPKCRALTDSRELGWLHVSEAERRQVAVALSKVGQALDDERELRQKQIKTTTQEDQVGWLAFAHTIVGDVARRGAETGQQRRTG